MGLDIHISTDLNNGLNTPEYHDPKHDYFHKHSLSRSFCYLMGRQDVVNGEPELDQIGRITSVDISPLYGMDTYLHGEALDFFLETAESEEERKNILDKAEQGREKLKGNIDLVRHTIHSLIEKLSGIDNLPDRLDAHGQDTLDNKKYFADFNIDKGDGYIRNNFGQDLRNFQRFLEYAKSRGATTVYFDYG